MGQGHPKHGHIRHYSLHNRGYVTCVYQLALSPSEPILLVPTVRGRDYHRIIICQRDAFVPGNQGNQTWPYTPLFIPQQRVWNLCVPNRPLTQGTDIAGTYSAGSRLPKNHNLAEGRLRFQEPRHPKLGNTRHYSFHNKGYVTCEYQKAPLIQWAYITGTCSAGFRLP